MEPANSSYKCIVMLEKCGHSNFNDFHLKWINLSQKNIYLAKMGVAHISGPWIIIPIAEMDFSYSKYNVFLHCGPVLHCSFKTTDALLSL